MRLRCGDFKARMGALLVALLGIASPVAAESAYSTRGFAQVPAIEWIIDCGRAVDASEAAGRDASKMHEDDIEVAGNCAKTYLAVLEAMRWLNNHRFTDCAGSETEQSTAEFVVSAKSDLQRNPGSVSNLTAAGYIASRWAVIGGCKRTRVVAEPQNDHGAKSK